MRSEEFWEWFEREARPKLAGRAETFAAMFAHLDGFDRPVAIVETGCIEEHDNWGGNGCSTIMFDRYVAARPGSTAWSIEISQEKINAAAPLCPNVALFCGDSVQGLERLADRSLPLPISVDLLYLDASHLRWTNPAPAALHHLRELYAAMPMIREDTLVVVDDSPVVADEFPLAYVGGKGQYVADHANQVGADAAFSKYQAGWTGMCRRAPQNEAELAALVERARSLVERDNAVAAAAIYRQVLVHTNPIRTGLHRIARGEACAFFAEVALRNARHGTAADWLRRAIDADPHAADYRCALVQKCFLPIGHLRAALTEAERAARVTPDYPRVWKILGDVRHEMGDAEKSVEAYDRALELSPNDADAMLDRTTIALDICDYETAERLCEKVRNSESERAPDALHCMGMVRYRQHRHEDAIGFYRAALDSGCRDAPKVGWNMSLALHAIGRYRDGWEAHEEREFCRDSPALYLPMTRFKLPRWRGEPCRESAVEPGRPAVIHVHYEAGAGDNLACARYLREIRNFGFRVRYECADEMVDLMRHSFPDVEVIPKAPDYPGALGIRPFDYHVPIGSLPAVFGTEVGSVPWRRPYLKADPILADRWRAKLEGFGPSVGFCWSSGIRTSGIWIAEYGRRKSMHFDDTLRARMAAAVRGFHPVSLQVGPEAGQAPGLMHSPLGRRPSWAETAALVANLDLVVTVDTGVAHLAGAMGKPTFLMAQRDCCSWHFLCHRPGAPWNEASPWYPSMRVFRQREFDRPHFWEDVVGDVAAAIADFEPARAAG